MSSVVTPVAPSAVTRRLRLQGFPIDTDSLRAELFCTATSYGVVESIVFNDDGDDNEVEIQFQRISSALKMHDDLCAGKAQLSGVGAGVAAGSGQLRKSAHGEHAARAATAWDIRFVTAPAHVGECIVVSSRKVLDLEALHAMAGGGAIVTGKHLEQVPVTGAPSVVLRAEAGIESLMEDGGVLSFLKHPTRYVKSRVVGRFVAIVTFRASSEANAFLVQYQALLAASHDTFATHVGPKEVPVAEERRDGYRRSSAVVPPLSLSRALEMMLTVHPRASLSVGDVVDGYVIKVLSNSTCIVDSGVVVASRNLRRVLMHVETHFVRVEVGQHVEARVCDTAGPSAKGGPDGADAAGEPHRRGDRVAGQLQRVLPSPMSLAASPPSAGVAAGGESAPTFFRGRGVFGEYVGAPPGADHATAAEMNSMYNSNPFLGQLDGRDSLTRGSGGWGIGHTRGGMMYAAGPNAGHLRGRMAPLQGFRMAVGGVPSVPHGCGIDRAVGRGGGHIQGNFRNSTHPEYDHLSMGSRGALSDATQQNRGLRQGSQAGPSCADRGSPHQRGKGLAARLFNAIQARKLSAAASLRAATGEHFFHLPPGLRRFSQISVVVERIGADGIHARAQSSASKAAGRMGGGEADAPNLKAVSVGQWEVFIPAAFVPSKRRDSDTGVDILSQRIHGREAGGHVDENWQSYAVEGESMRVVVLYAVTIGSSAAAMRIIASKRDGDMRQTELQLPTGDQLLELRRIQGQLQRIDAFRAEASRLTSTSLLDASEPPQSCAEGPGSSSTGAQSTVGGALSIALQEESEVAVALKETRSRVEQGVGELLRTIAGGLPIGTIVQGYPAVFLFQSPCGPAYLVRPLPSSPAAMFFLTAVCPVATAIPAVGVGPEEANGRGSDYRASMDGGDGGLHTFAVREVTEYYVTLVEEQLGAEATGAPPCTEATFHQASLHVPSADAANTEGRLDYWSATMDSVPMQVGALAKTNEVESSTDHPRAETVLAPPSDVSPGTAAVCVPGTSDASHQRLTATGSSSSMADHHLDQQLSANADPPLPGPLDSVESILAATFGDAPTTKRDTDCRRPRSPTEDAVPKFFRYDR